MAAVGGDPPATAAEHWEYCCVFKVGSPDVQLTIESAEGNVNRVEERRHFLQNTLKTVDRIQFTGANTKLLINKSETLIFCLIGASEDILLERADERDVDVLLDIENAIKFGQKLNFPLAESTDPLLETVDESTDWFGQYPSMAYSGMLPRSNWDHIYVKLDQAADDEFMSIYQHYDRVTNKAAIAPKRYSNQVDGASYLSRISLFDAKIRLRLLYEMLVSSPDDNGAWLQIEQMVDSALHPLDACYPLHAPLQLEELEEIWGDSGMFSVFAIADPVTIGRVRDYFAEEIGFMVAFLAFYTEWLKIPSCIALVTQGLMVVLASPLVVMAFAVFIIFWGQAMTEVWDRYEKKLMCQWGMTKYETKEVTRPQYEGDVVTCSVTGEKITRESKHGSIKRTAFSVAVFIAFIFGMLAGVIGTLIIRKVFENERCEVSGPIAMGCACLNSGLISLFGGWYSQIAPVLNEYENHRTNIQHQEAEIFKTFIFQFCNNFSCLFYYAFVHRQILPPLCKELVSEADIMYTVMVQLGTLFCINICAGNFMELYGHSMDQELSDEELMELDSYEQDYYKEHYEDTVEDYAETVIQFGYVTLFVVAFPMALPVAMVANMFEMNVVDRPKLLHNMRRPSPFGAAGIGGWAWCLNTTSTIAVLSNAGMFTWNTTYVSQLIIDIGINDPYVQKLVGDPYKWLVFLVMASIILTLKAAIAAAIPNEPLEVAKHKERQEHIEAEMVDSRRIEEEEEEDPSMAKRREEFRYGGMGDQKLDPEKYPPLDIADLQRSGGVPLETLSLPTVLEQEQARNEYDAMYEKLWPTAEPALEDL